jgi:3-oxoacyl-[acyl-carrier protein] reductase
MGTGASLEGKVALITGSSQGIGRAIAMTLAARGAAVAVNYSRAGHAHHAEAVAAQIERSGGRSIALCADVTVITQIQDLFSQTLAAFGALDIVVSNAGAGVVKPMIETNEAEYDALTALNAKAHYFVMREAALRLRDNGRIIVTSSSATAMPFPGSGLYAGAKAAAELYVRALAKEIGHRGITVNAVSPGPVMTESAMNSGLRERMDWIIAQTPLGRLGEPEDIAKVVAFLASDDAHWLTGQNLRAGGGIV